MKGISISETFTLLAESVSC